MSYKILVNNTIYPTTFILTADEPNSPVVTQLVNPTETIRVTYGSTDLTNLSGLTLDYGGEIEVTCSLSLAPAGNDGPIYNELNMHDTFTVTTVDISNASAALTVQFSQTETNGN